MPSPEAYQAGDLVMQEPSDNSLRDQGCRLVLYRSSAVPLGRVVDLFGWSIEAGQES